MELFGAELMAHRIQSGLRRMDLARRLNVQHTRVVKLETGENDPRFSTIVSLTNALGITPGELLDRVLVAYGTEQAKTAKRAVSGKRNVTPDAL